MLPVSLQRFIKLHLHAVTACLFFVLALAVRLYGLTAIPFQHDEFSALFRTGYNSISELITLGVIPDAHPAGTQLLLHWLTALFGWDSFWLKLPFALMGACSVSLIFLITRRISHTTAAVYAASLATTMQFFVFYSQIARPYSSGLFFVLMATYAAIVSAEENKPRPLWAIPLLIISLVLSAMMHYFATMMAGFIFIAYALMKGWRGRKETLLVGLVSLLLYAPNLPITIKQLAAGGIGDWLAKPTPSFIPDFFSYAFHFSWVFALAAAAILIVSFDRGFIARRWHASWPLFFICWFALTLLIALAYSYLRTPVIQFSTLYFSFPFLLMGLAALTRPLELKFNVLIASMLLGTGLITLLHNRQHYHMMTKQGYEQIAINFAACSEQFGKDITLVSVGGSERMHRFYLDQKGLNKTYFFNKDAVSPDYQEMIDSCRTKYLAIGWTDYASFAWIEKARSHFREVVDEQRWFNSGFYLLHRNDIDGSNPPSERLVFSEYQPTGIAHFTGSDAYGLLWEASADSLLTSSDGILVARIDILAENELDGVTLVMELKNSSSKQLALWRGGTTDGRRIAAGQKTSITVVHHIDAGPPIQPEDQLRVYVWNKKQEHFRVTGRSLYIVKHDPILFGFFAPL